MEYEKLRMNDLDRTYIYVGDVKLLEEIKLKVMEKTGIKVRKVVILRYAVRALYDHLDEYIDKIIEEQKKQYGRR